jgi:hypothetical protein
VGDRLDAVLAKSPLDEILVAHVADHERNLRRQDPREPGREIVEHDHILASVEQRQDHVTADITRAARHQNRHSTCLLLDRQNE